MPITTTEKSTGQQITIARINPNNARVLTQIQYNDAITTNGEQTINLPMPAQSVKFTVDVDGVNLPIPCSRFFVGQSELLVLQNPITTNAFTYTNQPVEVSNTVSTRNFTITITEEQTYYVISYDYVYSTNASSTWVPGGCWYYHGTFAGGSGITSLELCLLASTSDNPSRIVGGIFDASSFSYGALNTIRYAVIPKGIATITGLPGQNA